MHSLQQRIGLVLLLVLCSGSFSAIAQMKDIGAEWSQINPAIETVHGKNIARYFRGRKARGKLILMIEGTGASATSMHTIDSVFATMGFHVISLDYKNNVISTVCEHSKDSSCSWRFRKEIITGEPLSGKTDVDSLNSLINRFRSFLGYLTQTDPAGGWSRYLKSGTLQWSDIIVAGHSQGSGHAALLGKLFKVDRVLVFSGPQDYLIDLKRPSPWLSKKSATPENRYYAFLHLKDPFNSTYQIANCKKLMQSLHPDTAMVAPGIPIKGHPHILINNIATKDPHGSTLSTQFKNVWAYMLGIDDSPEYLHARGDKIVDGKGNEVLLRGIGLGGWMLQEPYMLKLSSVATNQTGIRAKIEALIGPEKTRQFYAAWLANGMQKSDVDSLKAWGFNSIRLPMHYNLYTPSVAQEPTTGKDSWRPEGFALTDSLLRWCAADQIYLILDLHAAPGGQGHDLPISDRDSTQPSLWQSAANRQKTIALWKQLAARYKDEKWIGGYDLINEPNWSFAHPEDKNNHGTKDSINAPLRSLYIAITRAIRSVDPHHMIIIEGNGWANNYKGVLPPWDTNMVISFHKYWNKNDVASIQKYLDLRTKYNLPLWLGESGENNNGWYRDAIQLMERHDIGWCWWPLKKIGTNNPFEVKMPAGFQAIIQYWKGKGPKPTVQTAFQALMQLADQYKTANLVVHYDVLKALFSAAS